MCIPCFLSCFNALSASTRSVFPVSHFTYLMISHSKSVLTPRYCFKTRCPVYVIHGSEDTIVPFYHGQTLFQTLPDKCKTVPFWARGAGHNNIEMDMPTAYIKRLQQFIRQCDRLNYPNQMSPRKQVKMMKHAQQQQQQGGGGQGG